MKGYKATVHYGSDQGVKLIGELPKAWLAYLISDPPGCPAFRYWYGVWVCSWS